MNPQPITKAAREALRRRMTELGSPIGAIAQEMRAAFGVRPREAWRHAYGWSQQDVADRVYAKSAELGHVISADGSIVGKWEKWPLSGSSSRRPTITVLNALAEVFGCTIEALLDLEDRRALPDSDRAILNRLAPAEPHGADLVRLAADESMTWARWADSSNVGDLTLHQLLGQAQLLASEYLKPDSNPLTLFSRTRTLRDRVFSLLEGHQHPHQTSDLYMVGGYVCGLLAWISSDLGHVAEAEAQGLTAWLCAELSRNNTLRSWVLSVRSKTAFWDGRMKDAIKHARHGAQYAPSGTATVLLACQQADAWSKLGAVEEAMTALALADAARDSSAGADDIGGLFACSPARQENYAAAVHLRIGQPAQALRAADHALELISAQPVRAYGTLAQIHISRAAAYLALGEPEGTHEALSPVLALPPDRRLATVSDRLAEISTSLGHLRDAGRAAVGLRAAIEEFRSNSAPRRLALSPGQTAD
ncbi:helix-turn-helix transcriptional regulator [Streptomyces sp. SRF1]|uniref:helix-turn-helix transcriptional regulator n=1 Tax=Streptomyces sp. SRF1 TaxID=1549642 RepID=UPI0025B1F6B4|nr:helix-turn-helix transcriptional regulator [Streptomyces sp. SRF1]MDN3060097.1 helix-turn-helix transcriptional regulator [Streptomyces sp. SRF1]